MFVGFKINAFSIKNEIYYYQKGKTLYDNNKISIKKTLSFLTENNSVLDASKIQGNWFPQIEADVFISHSHIDEKLAVAFAGWLYENFGLTSFIDSCVWGCCEELLKKIDNKYCKNYKSNTYNYNSRNGSTSIVHMLLMNALTRMIDKTECLFFMDTNNSIPVKDGIQKKTYSPWIFGEIETSRTIRRIKPDRLDLERICDTKYFSQISESASPKVAFSLGMDHLIDVNYEDLNTWISNCNPQSRPQGSIMSLKDCSKKKCGHEALNQLYLYKSIIK